MNSITTWETNTLPQQQKNNQALTQARRIGSGVALLLMKKPINQSKLH